MYSLYINPFVLDSGVSAISAEKQVLLLKQTSESCWDVSEAVHDVRNRRSKVATWASNYLLALNARTKDDFFLAAVFLCKIPLAANLSIYFVVTFKVSSAVLAFDSISDETFLVSVFNFDLYALFLMRRFSFVIILFFADLQFATLKFLLLKFDN